jgi:hypothetical protein
MAPRTDPVACNSSRSEPTKKMQRRMTRDRRRAVPEDHPLPAASPQFLGENWSDKPLMQRLNWLHVPLLVLTPLAALYGIFTSPFVWQTCAAGARRAQIVTDSARAGVCGRWCTTSSRRSASPLGARTAVPSRRRVTHMPLWPRALQIPPAALTQGLHRVHRVQRGAHPRRCSSTFASFDCSALCDSLTRVRDAQAVEQLKAAYAGGAATIALITSAPACRRCCCCCFCCCCLQLSSLLIKRRAGMSTRIVTRTAS